MSGDPGTAVIPVAEVAQHGDHALFGIEWVEEEFEALWNDSFPLTDAIVEEIKRVAAADVGIG